MAQAPVEPHPSPSAGPVVKEYTPEASTGKDINVGKPAEQLDLEPSAETSTAEDESTYTTGAKFYLIALSIGLVLIVAGMDASIVAVAVPSMTDEWHKVADIGWYSAAFRLCMCSFQFMFGKLYKLFSVKRIFLISWTIFLLGSALCAAAPSSTAFVVARAISGFATAGIICGCFTLLAQTLPLRKRALWTGIAGAVEGISVIAAPSIGGILTQKLSWRWCFWISLPPGGITWIIIAVVLKDLQPPERTSWKQKFKELDLIGNLVFVPSLTCLFMALSWAGTNYPWNSPIVIVLLCVIAVLLAVFAVDQWLKQDLATLPPRILKNRSVLAGFAFTLCCSSTMNVIEYYLPTYFQAVRQYSPGKSGVLMLPIVIGFLLSMLAQGAGVNMFGYYVPFMLAGSLLMPIFAGLMTTLEADTSIGKLIAYSGLLGVGCGIGFQAPQVAVQNSLPSSDAPMGLAVVLFAQSFGPAVFIAAAQTIFTNQLSENLHDIASTLNATSIENMDLSDLKSHIGVQNLPKVLAGFDKSMMHTWYLGVALACVTIVGSTTMEWRKVKHKRT